jgi:hypothetical protein
MSINFRYPNITGRTEREQLAQIGSFLRQLVDQLNFGFQNKTEDVAPQQNETVKTPGKMEFLKAAYPVGAIYLSTAAADPKTLFGFGTWERIQDRFLLAAGSTYAAGSTGGEATHTLTAAEMPSHGHPLKEVVSYSMFNADSNGGSYVGDNQFMLAAKRKVGATSGVDHVVSTSNLLVGEPLNNAGGSQPHNNMPPYTTVYVWKRTA